MQTASVLGLRLRILPRLAAAAFALVAASAHAAPDCGPSGRAGVDRCVVGLSTVTMTRMQQVQQASNWCWAASISMLLRRYGVEVPQRTIVQAHLGKMENVRITVDDMARLVDRRWTDAQGRSLVASVKPLPGWRMRLGVIAPEVLEDLAQQKPVILAAERHALLLVQVVYDRVVGEGGKGDQIELVRAVVLDPASPGGVRSLRAGERKPDMLALVDTQLQLPTLAADSVKTAQATPGVGSALTE